MNGHKTDKLSLQWRQDLLNLKERVKQKLMTTKQALASAENLKKDNESNFVKPNSDIQNAHIQLCESVVQADRIIAEYRSDNITYTTTTFNILISLSGDMTAAKYYFDSLLNLGLSPNTYTLNGFIAYTKTISEARESIKSMNRYGVKPNTQTYNAMISIATSAEEQIGIIHEMDNHEIEVNLVTFNTLISRSPNFPTAIKFYKELRARQIRPTINTLVTLMKKASTLRDIHEVETMLQLENIQTNNSWERLCRLKKYGN